MLWFALPITIVLCFVFWLGFRAVAELRPERFLTGLLVVFGLFWLQQFIADDPNLLTQSLTDFVVWLRDVFVFPWWPSALGGFDAVVDWISNFFASSPGGIQGQIETAAFNFGFVALYLLIRSVIVAPIAYLVRVIWRRIGGAVDPAVRSRWAGIFQNDLGFKVSSAGLAAPLICVAFLPVLYFIHTIEPDLANYSLSWIGEPAIALSDATVGILWSAPIIFCGELHALFTKSRETRTGKGPAKGASREDDDVALLYQKYLSTFGAHIAHHGVDGGEGAASAQPAPALSSGASDFRKRIDGLVGAEEADELDTQLQSIRNRAEPRQLWQGDLTQARFHLLAEVILDTLDKGGSTLIICPSDARETMEGNIRTAMGGRLGDLIAPNWGRLNEDWAKRNEVFPILIGSETDLEENLSKREDFEKEFRRLRLVIVVEVHRMDASILRQQLQLIWRRIDKTEVTVLSQSEGRISLAAHVAQCLATGDLFLGKATVSASGRKRHSIIWRDSAETAREVNEHALESSVLDGPKEMFPLVMTLAREADRRRLGAGLPERTLYLDPQKTVGRKDQTNKWQRISANLEASRNWLQNMVFDLRPRSHVRMEEAGSVVFMEERHNIFDAIDRHVDAMKDQSSLVQIVARNYPLFNCDLDHLRQTTGGTARNKKAFAAMDEDLLPMLPSPRGDIAQMATVIVRELIRDDDQETPAGSTRRPGISRRQLSELMGDLTPPEVASHLGLTASRSGMRRLLDLAFGTSDLKVERSSGEDHEILFWMDPASRAHVDRALLAQVILDGSLKGHVQQGDEGLTLVEGEPFRIGGELLRLDKIERMGDQIGRLVAKPFGGDQAMSRPELKTVRTYDFDAPAPAPSSGEAPPAAIREVLEGEEGRLVRALSHVAFARTTLNYYKLDEDRPVFADGEAPPLKSKPNLPRVVRRFKPAVLLRLPVSGGAADRVAFTLAATLQDVIRSLFGAASDRVAVISPQAAALASEMRAEGAERAKFCAGLYPAVAPDSVDAASALLDEQFSGLEVLTGEYVDLMVIEDAAYDIGVARALYDDWDKARRRWATYLHWCASNAGVVENGPWHGFGGPPPDALIDYDGALESLG